MKLNKFFNISAGIALILGGTACSSDYLDLEPEGTLDYQETLTNEEGATLAVYGMCNSMYKQYSGIDDGSLGFNGEPELVMYYGDAVGVDYVSTYWMMYGGITLLNWDGEKSSGRMNASGGSQPAWGYCYGIISQANNLLTYTPKVKDEAGNDVEKDYGISSNTLQYGYAGAYNPVPDVNGLYAFRYAQALTFRAHAYIRLLQIYCARFENRITTNGDWSLTVPLRLKYEEAEGDLNCPLATWEELVNQIYGDLAQALELYQLSGSRRSYEWEPDIDVAKGLFSRVAMINHDWETARTMASEARQNYPIMSMSDYNKGFAEPTSEWLWTNSGVSAGIYFWSFGALYACNGAYPTRWGTIAAGGINNDLINEFTSTAKTLTSGAYDQRASLFFSPRNVLGNALKLGFYDTNNCDQQYMNANQSISGDFHSEFVRFCTTRYRNVQDFGWLPPYTYYQNPISNNATTCAATFGAQFKFWGTDPYGTTFFPFMRSSELLLTEAEAAYMMGDESAADQLLYDLNINRYSTNNSGATRYTASYSGEKLYEAIKLYRRLELWGEGFSWFDAKRWNQPISRTAWARNDINSGNWPERFAVTFEVTASNGWRWRIPSTELNYNTAIDRSMASLGYDW